MNLLPSCSHYLRRIFRQYLASPSIAVPDLLHKCGSSEQNLEKRLHLIYSDASSHRNVVLYLEQLIYSHQQAHSHQNLAAKQDILKQIMWWLGYGINFDVGLPHPQSAESRPTASQIPTPPESTQPEIFIVEDSIDILYLVNQILSNRGYQIDSALSGYLALSKIQAHPPDLILLDIQLPDIDGYQIYKQLQSDPKTSHIPVIFLTGVEEPIEIQLKAYERLSYLAKPFKPERLIELVAQHLPSKPQPAHDDAPETALELRREQSLKFPFAHDLQVSLARAAESHYFFRANLDGRYLRVSPAFAQLCGYTSPEAMISQVRNLWQQVYTSADYQQQWNTCFQYPNQIRTLTTHLKNHQNEIVEVIETICLIQDSYQHPLFYQGFVRLNMPTHS